MTAKDISEILSLSNSPIILAVMTTNRCEIHRRFLSTFRDFTCCLMSVLNKQVRSLQNVKKTLITCEKTFKNVINA